jgi:hypothetical protein
MLETWMIWRGMKKTVGERHILLERRNPMAGAFMTCMGTCGSGVGTGVAITY